MKSLKKSLSHLISLVFFFTPWEQQKTHEFRIFPGGKERDQWNEMS